MLDRETPYVVINENRLGRNLENLMIAARISGDIPVRIFHAFKAFPLRCVLETLVKSGIDGVETHSLFESETLHQLAPALPQVIHGGGKESKIIEKAADNPLMMLVADSESELRSFSRASDLSHFGVRIHPRSFENHFFFKDCKLGVTTPQVREILNNSASTACNMLHLHLFNRFAGFENTTGLIEEIAEIWNSPYCNFSILDIGGGLNSTDKISELVHFLQFWQNLQSRGFVERRRSG